MKYLILTLTALTVSFSLATHAEVNVEVARCKGYVGNEHKEITLFRSLMNKKQSSLLYKSDIDNSNGAETLLFSGANTIRTGSLLTTTHPKMNLIIDLNNTNSRTQLKGKWDKEVDLDCEIIKPFID